MHVMNVGNQNRSVGKTDMNEHSSRSHAIFAITVECSELDSEGESHIRVGKLNLVDLAGSERQAKTHSTGDRFKEATEINLSLSALGNVISALVDPSVTHIRYRDSKLTRLLQDSLGGNSKTVMIATIGPASYNFEESLLTLRYANRAKNIKNKPRINEDPKDALLREFQDELSRLKSMMGNKKKKKFKEGKKGEEQSDYEEERDHEAYLKEERKRLESEKASLLQNTEIVEEEKDRMVNEVQKKMEEVKKEQKNRDNLAAKIKAMESKLLAGGKTISVHTAEQEKALAERKKQISAQKAREQEMRQKLEANKESASEIKETFDNLQEEVDNKTRKLKKLYHQLQLTKTEIEDHTNEQVRQKQDLLSAHEMLNKEIKFKKLVLENFVPPDFKDNLISRARYDEEKDEWGLDGITQNFTLENLRPRPGSALGFMRPYCAYARRMAATTNNPRYRLCNILSLELDMPTRTTRDYEEPAVNPAVQAAIDKALREDEEDLIVDCQMTEDKPIDYTKLSKIKKNPEHKSGRKSKELLYPATRGLISSPVRFV
ncbi:Kinesin-like protein KIF3B [Oopsacas minuta]|uniref:Kinesin-like protein n=1 Tax=Oopsacas minuta TaxID=111878 RepID=A0AAV7K130_9METZ|nr:Kinesin-like protein KIF3B [Oopsacas minuta]